MATRITTQTLARGVLDDVARASRRLAQTQQRLSSGQELTRPSDDPNGVARALLLRTELEGARQHQRTVADAEAWSDIADDALAGVTDAAQRVRELLLQGVTGTMGPDGREAIATEVLGLLDTLKAAGNANYGGRFIFSGTRTDVAPYAVGSTSDAYAGDDQAIMREIGPGVWVQVNVPGRGVLGDAGSGLLATVRGVADRLRSGTPADLAALRGVDLAKLDGHLDDVTALRAGVGATTNRLEAADGRLAEYELATTRLLSQVEDTDIARAMVDFSTQQAALQAALKAGASIVQNSLLDFLR